MKKRLLPLLWALLLLGCQAAPAPSPAQGADTFTDDLGREVSLAPARRTAAMIGSFADVWCLAGGKDALAAAANDTWTSFDLDLDESVVNIGTTTQPNLEVLLEVQPDLILASCNTSSNLALRETLESAGLRTAYFDVQSLDDYLRMLDFCTRLTGCAENYRQYGEAVRKQADGAIARQDGSRPTVLCLRSTGSSCKAKGSADNLLGEMLADLGCVNIADRNGSLLETLSLEAIIAADPDYIFAVLQGSDPTKAQATLEAALLSHPAWGGLRAVKEGRFYTLDHTLYNLKPNARWGEAYEHLADILYPEP